MKASSFPRQFIVFNEETGEFYDNDALLEKGFTLGADGLPHYAKQPFPAVILWYSGQWDKDKKKLYEGDIVRMFIPTEFGSQLEAYAVMRWSGHDYRFILNMGAQVDGMTFDVLDVEKVGHEFSHPDLLAKIMEKAKTITN